MASPDASDSPLAPAISVPWLPSHYQRTVLALCDRCVVTTREAVYTTRDAKLVGAGTRMTTALFERLMQHELRAPLENLLTLEGMVSQASLATQAHQMCLQDAAIELLVQDEASGISAAALAAPLNAISLPAALAFMLTVMRELAPEQLAHGLRVALIATYQGMRRGWNKSECTRLATAGLLHDIGILHLDPAWRDAARPMPAGERQQLATHPSLAARLVHGWEVYPQSVAVAILEHHERMDGSGYPRGIRGEQISEMGQMLLLAEVVSAFFEKYANDGASVRLSLALRMDRQKFPVSLAALLLPLLQSSAIQPGTAGDLAEIRGASHSLAQALHHWGALQAGLPAGGSPVPEDSPASWIAQRLATLQTSLFDTGAHPDHQAELLPLLQADPAGVKELLFLLREALWQLQSIANTALARWPALDERDDPHAGAARAWCDALLRSLPEGES